MKSFFESVEHAPPDPIFGLTAAFQEDPRTNKQNLGVGVYQDELGKTQTMQVVQKATELLARESFSTSYLPMSGFVPYINLVQELVFANTQALADRRVATVQTIGGTGALRVGAEFLHQLAGCRKVLVSNPTWGNHKDIFGAVGYQIANYPYYDDSIGGVNFDQMVGALQAADANTVILLHACCHNPTGADLTLQQWQELAKVFEAKNLIPFFDFAYQGFEKGVVEDRASIHSFLELGLEVLVAQSFSKSFSLYNRRIGNLSIVTAKRSETDNVLSQMKAVVRRNYSNPPADGARIVAKILGDADLYSTWLQELEEMRLRICGVREKLVELLKSKGVALNFDFMLKQNGMFSYTGLSAENVEMLREKHAIYLLSSGRICVAALNDTNLEYVADAVADVLKG